MKSIRDFDNYELNIKSLQEYDEDGFILTTIDLNETERINFDSIPSKSRANIKAVTILTTLIFLVTISVVMLDVFLQENLHGKASIQQNHFPDVELKNLTSLQLSESIEFFRETEAYFEDFFLKHKNNSADKNRSSNILGINGSVNAAAKQFPNTNETRITDKNNTTLKKHNLNNTSIIKSNNTVNSIRTSAYSQSVLNSNP